MEELSRRSLPTKPKKKSMFSSMFGSTKSTFFVETGEKKPSSGDTTGCGKAPPKGTKAAFTWCRKNNVPYVEPYSDADGDGDPGDYADCLLQHAKFVLANVATHECSVNCANYLNRNEQKAAKERREKENSMKGGFATLMTKIGGIFTNHDPFPDPQFQRCPSALSRRRLENMVLANGEMKEYFRNTPTSIVSAALSGRVLLKVYQAEPAVGEEDEGAHPPSSPVYHSELCLGMLSSGILEKDSALGLLPCSSESVLTIGLGALTPAPRAEMTARTHPTYNLILEGDMDKSSIFANRSGHDRSKEDLWKDALSIAPTRCLRVSQSENSGSRLRAVMSRECCLSGRWGIRSQTLQDIDEERTGCMKSDEEEERLYLDGLARGVGRWDLKSIMRSDSSESPMKGGMLCTADINGGDPCSLCLSVTNSDGARLLPCKEGRHTMFVAVPESQWAFEQQREKEKTLWERSISESRCRVSRRA